MKYCICINKSNPDSPLPASKNLDLDRDRDSDSDSWIVFACNVHLMLKDLISCWWEDDAVYWDRIQIQSWITCIILNLSGLQY